MLRSLQWEGHRNYHGNDTVIVAVNDNGHSGVDGAKHAETRAFRCERALCANHAPFKTRAEVALHAKRVHTLDKAEARELKMRAEMDALRARVDDAKAEGDVLRRAVDVLSAALKHATRRKRPRRG